MQTEMNAEIRELTIEELDAVNGGIVGAIIPLLAWLIDKVKTTPNPGFTIHTPVVG
jgi:bacteriocin-like protein